MGIQKLDKPKWIDVCAALSIGLLGKRAEIEVVSPIDGIACKPAPLGRWFRSCLKSR
jgi:hypothetical protein